MNKALIIIALAAVTFGEAFLGTLLVAGLTDLSPTALQTAAIGAAASASSVLINGLGKLHAYLAARA